VHPEASLDRFIQTQHEQHVHRHERLLRARTQVDALVSEFLSSRPGLATWRDVTHVPSAEAVHAELVTLVGRAEREVLAVHTRGAIARQTAGALLPVQLGGLRRGLAVRIILPAPWQPDDAVYAAAAEQGANVRLIDDAGVDVTVVDRRFGILQPASSSAAAGGLLIRAPDLTGLATALFDQLWRAAEPAPRSPAAGAPAGVEPGAPSEQERLLLRLLGDGVKDEAVARALGVSVRTVRRMIADLMRRLGARSRFQAGVLAIQRGWLERRS
jgi:DNA-binding NarL/FixJ family response regulator